LKLQSFAENERTITWIPGSFARQDDPFVPEPKAPSIFDFLIPTESHKPTTPPLLHYPGYLLLTNMCVYIFTPKFRLASLKATLQDEQTSYYDPSRLLRCKYKFSLNDIARLDVGLRRQFVTFHFNQPDQVTPTQPNLVSILFQTRSRHSTTVIVDTITTTIHESEVQSQVLINQDVEWCIKNIQKYILLRPDRKKSRIRTYNSVWHNDTPKRVYEIQDAEFDSGYTEDVTKVDFNFVKMYLLCGFLRYNRPVVDADCRGVEIQHTSLLASSEYLYLIQENLNAWPPVIFPPEFNPIGNVNSPLTSILSTSRIKGLLIDTLPQFGPNVGVGRIKDVCQIERWRSYKIDEALGSSAGHSNPDFKGLGRALQNGHVGHFDISSKTQKDKQQGTLSGWMHWIRIIFGKRHDVDAGARPISAPTCIPSSNDQMEVWYWYLKFN
jgi:ribosomal protein S24E